MVPQPLNSVLGYFCTMSCGNFTIHPRFSALLWMVFSLWKIKIFNICPPLCFSRCISSNCVSGFYYNKIFDIKTCSWFYIKCPKKLFNKFWFEIGSEFLKNFWKDTKHPSTTLYLYDKAPSALMIIKSKYLSTFILRKVDYDKTE